MLRPRPLRLPPFSPLPSHPPWLAHTASAHAGPSSPPRQALRWLTTATATPPGKEASSHEASQADEHAAISPLAPTPAPTPAPALAPAARRTPGKAARRPPPPRPRPHPLIRQFYAQLYSPDTKPDPEQVWSAYYELFRPLAMRKGLHTHLKSDLHRHMLRAISPGWPEERLRDRAYQESKAGLAERHGKDVSEWTAASFRLSILSRSPFVSASSSLVGITETYVDRILFILQQAREAESREAAVRDKSDNGGSARTSDREPERLSIVDYNLVLKHAAKAGAHSFAELLWQQIHELNILPNRRTYYRLIRAHSYGITTAPGSPSSVRQKRLGKVNVRPRDEKVTTSSRAAAARTVDLIQDMLRRGLTPNRPIIDYTLRLLRLGRHYKSFVTLLKSGYNLDLNHVEAYGQGTAADHTPKISIQTLNEIILALGEHRNVSEMLATFELLTVPSHRQHDAETSIDRTHDLDASSMAPDAAVPEASTNYPSFKDFINDLFYTDPNALSKTGILEMSKQEQGNLSTSSDVVMPIASPNTDTFENLILHCCGTADGSELSEAEVAARWRGAYRSVAHYFLHSALDQYRARVLRIAPGLGLRDEAGLSLQPLPNFGQKAPTFELPPICPKMQLFSSIFGLASRRRDRQTLTWLMQKVQEAVGLMTKEQLTLRFAVELWRVQSASNKLEQWTVKSLCKVLDIRAKYVATECRILTAWAERHIEAKIATVSAHKDRRMQRKIAKLAATA